MNLRGSTVGGKVLVWACYLLVWEKFKHIDYNVICVCLKTIVPALPKTHEHMKRMGGH
jgi:hypothetical protein